MLVQHLLATNLRLQVLRQPRSLEGGAIPHARSKWEAMMRKVIGGGEIRNWAVDSSYYRGGGNLSDALRLLIDASEKRPGTSLREQLPIDEARRHLLLPSGLPVPVGRAAVSIKNFNHEATAGPSLRAFGIKRKWGLKEELEDFAWECYSRYADRAPADESLPFVAARVGYRTKLVTQTDAVRKVTAWEPIGRCLMMFDAHEQAFSSPLYNVLSNISHMYRFNRKLWFSQYYSVGVVRLG